MQAGEYEKMMEHEKKETIEKLWRNQKDALEGEKRLIEQHKTPDKLILRPLKRSLIEKVVEAVYSLSFVVIRPMSHPTDFINFAGVEYPVAAQSLLLKERGLYTEESEDDIARGVAEEIRQNLVGYRELEGYYGPEEFVLYSPYVISSHNIDQVEPSQYPSGAEIKPTWITRFWKKTLPLPVPK